MEIKDKNDTVVPSFKIMDDGIVYGFSGVNGIGYTTVSLGQESCNAFKFTYSNNNCYWSITHGQKELGTNLVTENKIRLKDSDRNVDEVIISYDYIIQLNANDLTSTNDLGIKLSELKIDFKLYENNVSHYTESLFKGSELRTHLTTGTGIYTVFGSYTPSQIVNFIQMSAGYEIKQSKLLEGWTSKKRVLPPSDLTLARLVGKSLQIGVKIDNYFDGISVKISDVKIISKINHKTVNVERIDVNPSYEFSKVIDNKKSWDSNLLVRKHESNGTHTYYKSEEELILNNKELDLSFTISNIPINRFWENALSSIDKIYALPYVGGNKVDMSFIINDLKLTDIDTLDEFRRVLIERYTNVRSNRLKNKNNLLKLLYYGLLRESYSMINYYEYTFSKILDIDEYWLDIVEDFIPSTAIWDGVIKISNNEFGDNSFDYKGSNITTSLQSNNHSEVKVDIVYYNETSTGKISVLKSYNVPVTAMNVSYSGIQDAPLIVRDI